MKVLYIHQYFKSPKEPGGTRSYWIAQELINRDHQVIMLTSSSEFENKVTKKNIDGIEVIYIKESYNQDMSILRRLLSFLKFMLKSTLLAYKQKNIDLVFATSTPLTIGFPAIVLKWFKGVKFIFEVRDLWPEVPIQMGGLKNPIVKKLAILFEKIIYKNAEHVVALSPGMQDGVIKHIPKDKTSMITNMAKIDQFYPRNKQIELVEKLGLGLETFKIIHFGSLGFANGIDKVIESAKLLKSDNSIEFVFLGDGSMKAKLKQECMDKNLSNVKFLGAFPMSKTSEIVNLCDVSLVSFKDIPILYTNSPNKLFDSLSAGKPIIVNSAGWTKQLVEENNCGIYVDPNDKMDLVEKIKYLQKNPNLVEEMGRNSRKLAEIKFDKAILTKQMVDTIERVCNK